MSYLLKYYKMDSVVISLNVLCFLLFVNQLRNRFFSYNESMSIQVLRVPLLTRLWPRHVGYCVEVYTVRPGGNCPFGGRLFDVGFEGNEKTFGYYYCVSTFYTFRLPTIILDSVKTLRSLPIMDFMWRTNKGLRLKVF